LTGAFSLAKQGFCVELGVRTADLLVANRLWSLRAAEAAFLRVHRVFSAHGLLTAGCAGRAGMSEIRLPAERREHSDAPNP
jgi:hypothetical protein